MHVYGYTYIHTCIQILYKNIEEFLFFLILFSTDGSESPTLAESDADGHEKPRVKYGELVILG